jgi:hypothetical protein
MHDPDGFVRSETWLWPGCLVPELFLSIGDPIGEDDSDAFVEEVAAFSRAADMKMDEVA